MLRLLWLALGATLLATTPAPGRIVLLGARTRHVACARSALPDRRCSPGAYSNGLMRAVLCSPTFRTSTIRNVPQREKFAVEREYGLPARLYGHTLEIDHIVPLELGGANVIANLFPERSYRAKDRLENRLHDLVCSGRLKLGAARVGIARNWVAMYHRIYGSS